MMNIFRLPFFATLLFFSVGSINMSAFSYKASLTYPMENEQESMPQENVDLDGLNFADNNCPDSERGKAIRQIHKDLQAKNISRMSASSKLSRKQQNFVNAVRNKYRGIPDDNKAGFANELAGLSRNHMTLQQILSRLDALGEKYGYTGL